MPPRLTVQGELSDFKSHGSGHCYFSIKDKNAVVPCVMWASNAKKLKFQLDNGLFVLAKGHIDVYVPGGKYQFYVTKLEPQGAGALQLAFEQMYRKLQDEGLFDHEHKKNLPSYPNRIGIVTSSSGAAVDDIRTSVLTRWPCELLYFDVPVQGDDAAKKIALTLYEINAKNKKNKLDLLIVGRGGGSRQDLWAFNEEALARAIFDSDIPVISAVGHEYDTSISDLVADARASTPTKAGVIAVPDIREVKNHLNSLQRSITAEILANYQYASSEVKNLCSTAVIRNPLYPVMMATQKLDELIAGLMAAGTEKIHNAKEHLFAKERQTRDIEPHRLIDQSSINLTKLQNRCLAASEKVRNNSRLKLVAMENRLGALNPKAVLKRGYSMTTLKENAAIITSASQLKAGDIIITEFADENLVESQVKKTQNKQAENMDI